MQVVTLGIRDQVRNSERLGGDVLFTYHALDFAQDQSKLQQAILQVWGRLAPMLVEFCGHRGSNRLEQPLKHVEASLKPVQVSSKSVEQPVSKIFQISRRELRRSCCIVRKYVHTPSGPEPVCCQDAALRWHRHGCPDPAHGVVEWPCLCLHRFLQRCRR